MHLNDVLNDVSTRIVEKTRCRHRIEVDVYQGEEKIETWDSGHGVIPRVGDRVWLGRGQVFPVKSVTWYGADWAKIELE